MSKTVKFGARKAAGSHGILDGKGIIGTGKVEAAKAGKEVSQ